MTDTVEQTAAEVVQAEQVANQLVMQLMGESSDHGISAQSVLVGIVIAQRFLEDSFPGGPDRARELVLEGLATYDLMRGRLRSRDT